VVRYDNPCLDTPCLDTPCLDTPCLDTPCLDTPCLDTPDSPTTDYLSKLCPQALNLLGLLLTGCLGSLELPQDRHGW
jgi:hypothetical protein